MNEPLPLVLLHAFPFDSRMWREQVSAFSNARLLLAPDMPGFGGNPPREGGLEAFAGSVVQACDAAGIGKAVFLGLSMGGYVAMRIADEFPERVAALVLADTRAGADDEAGKQKRTDQAARARTEGTAWMPATMVPALLGETTRRERPELVERVSSMMRGADPEGVARALEAMRERPDSFAALSSLRAPVLALAGEEDGITPPSEAERMAMAAPHGEWMVIPKAGHLSNLENPRAFDEAVSGFFDRVDRS